MQYLLSMGLVIVVSAMCFALSYSTVHLDHRVVALILLLTVSIIAVTFDILPVLCTAAFTAFTWDFFFIPPRFTLQTGTTEDTVLLVMYFIIAMVNAVLTYKIRQMEKLARKKIERANTIKLYNTMLNSLSHELRTPIAAIIGATDNLKMSDSLLDKTTRLELVNEISKASLRLNQQVENLLNMSRLESGFAKPKKDWCDITELVHNVVSRVEENSGNQQIHIHIRPGIPLFKTDKGMLEQVLYNVVNNAAIHTTAGSKIDVYARDHADILQLVVEDNGSGFPTEEIANVFDKFYRLKNTNASGTGLGLSIVKGFTEALGGSVKLENIHGGGAKFSIEIPGETSNIIV
jgi:two-component system sensor histidine kinase KdpD